MPKGVYPRQPIAAIRAGLTPEIFRHLYYEEKLSYEDIGKRFGISYNSVKRFARHHGFVPRGQEERVRVRKKVQVRMYSPAPCERCGTIMQRRSGNQRFCRPCWMKHRQETARQTFIGLSPRPCIQCGELIEHPTSPAQRYCPSCRRNNELAALREAAKKRRLSAGSIPVGTKLQCQLCEGTFEYVSGPQRYCPECRHIRKQIFWSQRQEYRAYTPIILERDGYKCRICGSRKRLHIHHYDGRGAQHPEPNHDHSNLITLCASCHIRVHLGKLVCPKPVA